jgi:hypothetical protein
MRRTLVLAVTCAAVAAVVATAFASSSPNARPSRSAVAAAMTTSPTERIAGPQHFCGTNGVTCSDPATNWDEIKGYDKAVAHGAPLQPYIGHDEPMIQWFSNRHGSGNDVTYKIRLPKDPPVTPQQDGSGGNDNFQERITFWFNMHLCDNEGTPNPDGAALSGHPTRPCTPDSDSNLFASEDPASPKYFGLGPGQGYMEMQFYPPGWAPWPNGISCTANKWCAALNIDTFQNNENTGDLNNDACLNTVGPEPVNFAFITKNGVAADPGSPLHPEHFVPNLARDFLMRPGDVIRLHMFDNGTAFEVDLNDLTSGKSGSMTASAANGFESIKFDPSGTTCQGIPTNYRPMYDTSNPAGRNFSAAHTGNIGFSDEIGHFEYCAAVRDDPLSSCSKPLGDDTNDPDDAGPDPQGDDVFCLPASASLKIKIGGCVNTDGDFDSVSYNFTWPGSISDPIADRRLNAQPLRVTSPLTNGHNFGQMAFESNISRSESDDTAFRVSEFCQRHITNPSDPNPGEGCVNPPPHANFYPFYSTTFKRGSCWFQQGGPYIPGTIDNFGGSAQAEYGPLRAIDYPTAPFGTITSRFNDFRSDQMRNPCPATP